MMNERSKSANHKANQSKSNQSKSKQKTGQGWAKQN